MALNCEEGMGDGFHRYSFYHALFLIVTHDRLLEVKGRAQDYEGNLEDLWEGNPGFSFWSTACRKAWNICSKFLGQSHDLYPFVICSEYSCAEIGCDPNFSVNTFITKIYSVLKWDHRRLCQTTSYFYGVWYVGHSDVTSTQPYLKHQDSWNVTSNKSRHFCFGLRRKWSHD